LLVRSVIYQRCKLIKKSLLKNTQNFASSFILLLCKCTSIRGENSMAVKARANIRLRFQTEKQLKTLLDALTPEVKAPVTRRVKVKLQKDGLYLVLAVEAADTVALRSTLNAYLRWINSTVSVIGTLERTVC
jgi:tRNA threonylcarbamoyladenosine modification (KEOPS) complex  Pcc1 subunit